MDLQHSLFHDQINLIWLLSPLDWIFFFSILFVTLAAVIYGHLSQRRGHRKNEQAHFLELLLMGRRLSLPLFVATLVATWYGGIFGVTKIAFEQGIYNFITQGFFWYLSYFIFALFIVDKIASYEALTLPDLVGKMFGPRAGRVSALFNFFSILPITYVISLGLFIQMLLPLSFPAAMGLGVGFVLLYSMGGSLRAVVFSDLIQFMVMCLGVFLVLLFSVIQFGGLSFLREHLPSQHWNPTGNVGLATTLAWGFIALSTLVDPHFYQRCFAARSSQTAKKGIFISIFIWCCFDLCTTFGALYAKALIPSADSGKAYLIYALQLLPDGLRGFVLAGILATILSTLDSTLFLGGTLVSYDLAPTRWRGKIFLQRGGVLLVAALSLLLALLFKGNIERVWKTLGSYHSACLLLPLLCGHFFPRKIKDQQFVWASLLGVMGISLWPFLKSSLYEFDELYVGMAFTGLGLLLYPYLAAFLFPQTKRKGTS